MLEIVFGGHRRERNCFWKKLQGVNVAFARGCRHVTLNAAIVLHGGAYVPAFLAVIGP